MSRLMVIPLVPSISVQRRIRPSQKKIIESVPTIFHVGSCRFPPT